MEEMIIYHGSQYKIELPKFGKGKIYNDYGQGFYCTENLELAKEWACPIKQDGYANKYKLSLDGLKVMRLTDGNYNILNWLAILLKNRHFDTNSPIGNTARSFIIDRFLPNTHDVDIIAGYRADDSYFAFAEDFVNNTISLRDLSHAMQLGNLGEQVVLVSEQAFTHIEFAEAEVASWEKYYYKRNERDKNARIAYKNTKKNLQLLMSDIFVLDIIREDMKNEDTRLRSIIS